MNKISYDNGNLSDWNVKISIKKTKSNAFMGFDKNNNCNSGSHIRAVGNRGKHKTYFIR